LNKFQKNKIKEVWKMQENKRDQEENRFLEIPKYPHNSFQKISVYPIGNLQNQYFHWFSNWRFGSFRLSQWTKSKRKADL
jgi:hypothetical protein